MKYKIPDILAMGFICQFILFVLGGWFGFIMNWIIFGGFAFLEYSKYLNSDPGIKKQIINNNYSNSFFNSNKYYYDTGIDEKDRQAISAARSILHSSLKKNYIDNKYGEAVARMRIAIPGYKFKLDKYKITMTKINIIYENGIYKKIDGKIYNIN